MRDLQQYVSELAHCDDAHLVTLTMKELRSLVKSAYCARCGAVEDMLVCGPCAAVILDAAGDLE